MKNHPFAHYELEHAGTHGAESHSDSDLVRLARLTSAAGGAIVAPGGGHGVATAKARLEFLRSSSDASQQSRSLDAHTRHRLINELQKVVLENAYYIPGLWWTRSVVHWVKVKNSVAPPNHFSNQKLQDVWLSED